MKPKLRVGISPCPNDTFIFKELFLGRLSSELFDLEFEFHDVQTLNEEAARGEFDLVKISFGNLYQVESEYQLLSCGGAMGYGCGPLLIQKNNNGIEALKNVWLPGKNTTARYLYEYWKSQIKTVNLKSEYAFFDEIYEGIQSGQMDSGVIIHENRFTYEKDGLNLIEDLGSYWEKQTLSPIPLGGIILHNKWIELGFQDEIEKLIRKSIDLAWANPEGDMEMMKEKAQIDDEQVVKSHIQTYVNEFSKDIGPEGKKAVTVFRDIQEKLRV